MSSYNLTMRSFSDLVCLRFENLGRNENRGKGVRRLYRGFQPRNIRLALVPIDSVVKDVQELGAFRGYSTIAERRKKSKFMNGNLGISVNCRYSWPNLNEPRRLWLGGKHQLCGASFTSLPPPPQGR